ncbi:FadR family transcriptional regulator [Arthrobacter sp. 24S4-2]|uniref:FadR/GntR family transcriptional regulator n=1 Tax=Arthrobacter sp. 24S4-2 TaxID=2575374 RepID=UPI0010C79A5D|nr:FadR/GntR family transcriptional regulator [Arthrobacter sp. 24S4-2]QCP00067.1 FadR family transcriptional regulator [Arthrobacter sp. 24S4-2]
MNDSSSDGLPTVRRSQTDHVVASILAMVDEGRLSAGDRLPIEKDLAELVGVSRSSLREGVRALAVLGVLETRQGDGTYVTSLDASKLLGPLTLFANRQMAAEPSQLIHVRRVLEAESASLAARRVTDRQVEQMSSLLARVDALLDGDIDETSVSAIIDVDTEFHRSIASASGNPLLGALVDSLAGRTYRTRVWRAMTEQGATATTQAEHRGILEAIRRRDPDRARLRMHAHLLAVEDFADTHNIDTAPTDSDSDAAAQ